MQILNEKVVDINLVDKSGRTIGLMIRTFISEADGATNYHGQILALRDGKHFGSSTKAEYADTIEKLNVLIDARVSAYIKRAKKARS